MKKNIVFYLFAVVILLTLLFSACVSDVHQSTEVFSLESTTQPEEKTIHNEQTFPSHYDNRYNGAPFPIIETEQIIYMLSPSNCIHYYDKASGLTDYLCFQPQCTHEDESCGAYIGFHASLFEIYDGSLFFSRNRSAKDGLEIIRCRQDGSHQELVRRLDYAFALEYQPQYFVLHRGCCYAVGCRSDVSAEGSIASYISITAFSIDNSADEIVTVFEKSFNGHVSRPNLCCVGQYIYFAFSEGSEDGTIGVFYRWDCSTEELELLFSGNPEGCQTNLGPGSFWAKGEDCYFISHRNGVLLIWRLSDGILNQVLSDDDFVHAHISDGVICLFKGILGETGVVRLVDFQGNQLAEYSFENQGGGAMLGGNREAFYLVFPKLEDGVMNMKLLLLDLAGQGDAFEIMNIQ